MGRFGRLHEVMRRLGRAPVFTILTLITLAVGIGATTLIFSVVDGVLLRPLPYPHPEQLIGVWHSTHLAGLSELNMSPGNYFIYREQNKTLEDIGAFSDDSLTVTGAGEPEHVLGLDVTDGTLPILGVKPAVGRLFTRADDTVSAPQTVVLGYAYWQKKFGGSTEVVGRSITVDGKSREIIGVLPKDFHFLDQDDASLVLPMQWDRSKTHLGNFGAQAVARIKPGVTIEQASADLGRLIPVVWRSFPAPEGFNVKMFEDAHFAMDLHLLKQDVVGDIGNVLWVLMGSIAMVLLIACANVANLLLVRVEGRRQELAIRAALGAGSRRIAGDLLFESVALAIAGGVLGLGLAYAGVRVLVAMAPTGLPRIHEIGINLPVLLFTLAVAIGAGVLIGLFPMVKFAGGHLSANLQEGGRAQSQSRERHRARNALVVIQVALALVLLICSGLMIRTFRALIHVNPGFAEPDSLQTFRIYVPETDIPDAQPDRVVRLEQGILDKLAALPGVSSVSIASQIPMTEKGWTDPVWVQDHTYREGELPALQRFNFVSPGYFKTMGTPMVAGRDLTWADTYKRLPVAVVSENVARESWHNPQDALGKRIRVGNTDDWREVVGVVGDVYLDGASQKPPGMVYWPLISANFEGQKTMIRRNTAIVIRTSRAGSEVFMQEVRRAVWSSDSSLPLAEPYTMGYYYTKSMARTSFTLVMLAVAGAMALLLGVVGVYGVISYSVSQRTREIGIRMALGAQRQAITGMFVRDGLVLAGIGIVCGLAASFAAMRLMKSLLFGVSPVDPLTYIAITVGVLGTVWLACYLPSRRAAEVDPMNALRAE